MVKCVFLPSQSRWGLLSIWHTKIDPLKLSGTVQIQEWKVTDTEKDRHRPRGTKDLGGLTGTSTPVKDRVRLTTESRVHGRIRKKETDHVFGLSDEYSRWVSTPSPTVTRTPAKSWLNLPQQPFYGVRGTEDLPVKTPYKVYQRVRHDPNSETTGTLIRRKSKRERDWMKRMKEWTHKTLVKGLEFRTNPPLITVSWKGFFTDRSGNPTVSGCTEGSTVWKGHQTVVVYTVTNSTTPPLSLRTQ